jgi:hypothetical protein
MEQQPKRTIREIAADIRRTWKNVWFGAVPYLEAMETLNTMQDHYGLDDAEYILQYFLANANTWRGEDARRIKAEIKALIKAG